MTDIGSGTTGREYAQAVLAGEPWLPTPLLQATSLGAELGCDLWLKREDCTPAGSFKLRGALTAMARHAGELAGGLWVASAGNYGLAIALAGRRWDVDVTVVVPRGATRSKVERIRRCGGTIVEEGRDFDAAKAFARHRAGALGVAFWEDGVVEEMAWGAATIATEILDAGGSWDVALVPLGNGSLIKGVAGALKARSPGTTVVGLVSSGAPAMAHAIRDRAGRLDEMPVATIADGLAVRVPIPGITGELRDLVDDVWIVDESRLMPAVRALMETEQVLAEPSAAITVAAAAEHRSALASKRVAAILTGAHLSMELLPHLATAGPLSAPPS